MLDIFKDATDFLYEYNESTKRQNNQPTTSDSRLRNLCGVYKLGREVYSEVSPLVLHAMEKKKQLGHIKLNSFDEWHQTTRKIRISRNQPVTEAVVGLGHELGHEVSGRDYFKGLQPLCEVPARATEMEVSEHIKRLGMNTHSYTNGVTESLTNLIRSIKAETDVITGKVSPATPNRYHDIYRSDVLPHYFGAVFNVLRADKYTHLAPLDTLFKMKNQDVIALTKQMTQSKQYVRNSLNEFLERNI